MKYYVNPNVRDTLRIFPEQGRYSYKRYDLNENPEGLPKDFVDSVLAEITPEFLSIYPEPDIFLNKYANFIGASYENVLTTNGSDMGIRYLLETFGEPGKKVVTVAPSFEMYRVNCSLLGLQHQAVFYKDDLTIDIADIVAAVDEDTRIVVLLNPNNPMGNVYTEEELEAVIARAKEVGAIVIVDEAYHYFYDKTFLPYALKEENVIILRTFSKAMSLAAVRLGVIISNPQLIHYVKNLRVTFEANSIALLFAERLLDHPEVIDHLIATEREGRAYTLETLKNKGYWVKDCMGNFIFVETKHDPYEVARRLKEEKQVLVHTFGHPLLKNYLRISIGSKAAMDVFLEAFLEVDGE